MNDTDRQADRMKQLVRGNFDEMKRMLEAFASEEENVEKICAAAAMMTASIRQGGKIIACGNGGSMCDASHFCEELLARFRTDRTALPAIAVSDPAYLTCVGNDFGFDRVFSRFVEAMGRPGDILLGISTSGNSTDVVLAAQAARERGMKVVALTGRADGKLSACSDLLLSTPPSRWSDRVQEIHEKVIHTLVQLIETELGLDA